MKNHCGESVGFSFRAALWFRQWFCLCEVSEINVVIRPSSYFSPSSVMILLLSFLVSLFSSLDQIASFQLKQIVVLCSVCVVISLRDCDWVWLWNYNRFRVLHAVDSLNVLRTWIPIGKSKAILYHADISNRYFLVCHLKIVFNFLYELKERSSDVTGLHFI